MARPLGLPVGSVRALCLLGLTARAILTLRESPPVEPWLWAALLVTAVAYFSARAASRAPADGAEPARRTHPLGLPRGTIRILFLAAAAYGAYLYFKEPRPTED